MRRCSGGNFHEHIAKGLPWLHRLGANPTDLDDPRRIASGAAEYQEMCSGCHLAPGMRRTEISQELYPRAPELSRGIHLTPAQEFWVVEARYQDDGHGGLGTDA